MYYLENGEYKESKDLIESFADGAIARYGIYRTIFSPELNVPAVFDIQTPEGRCIRGGVRAIHLTDIANGNSIVVGTIKNSTGELIPPNQIVYRSAFEGVDADVLYIWKHNAFCQNVIIRENPGELPAGFARATTRLEIVTELVETPEVQITGQILRQPGRPDLMDDGLISFGQMLAVPGLAFPVAGDNSLNLTGPNSSLDNAVPVLKQWKRLEDGRTFVIESVAWEEIEPLLRGLRAQANNAPRKEMEAAQGRPWPNAVAVAQNKPSPMQVASAAYQPRGYLVDLELLSGSTSSKTFLAGTTYYIPSFYAVTASSTFQGGATIKLGPSATLSLSGSFTSPTVGVATLTSRDDNTAGETVVNAGNPPYTSDGVVSASDWSNAGLSLYNCPGNTLRIRRFRVRYANRGISDYSPYYTHFVQFCRMEYCGFGVFAYYTTVIMANNEVCNVATNGFAYTGAVISESGTTMDCGPLYRTQAFPGIDSGEVFDGQPVLNPPDTMGCIGQNYFIELINGAIVVFSRTTGQRVGQMSIDNFFQISDGNVSYPRDPAHMNDPRIIFDHRKSRWYAVAKENLSVMNNKVILAVSKGSDPIGDPFSDWRNLNWDRFLLDVGQPNVQTDFPTLGTDDNGVYIGSAVFGPEACCSTLVAIEKSPLLAIPPALNVTYFRNIPLYILQPVVNFDPVSTSGPAWVVTHRHGYFQDLLYATLIWQEGTPSLSAWATLSTPEFGLPQFVPSKDSTSLLPPGSGGTLAQAVIRNSSLWTCREVGLNSAGGATNVDRTGCEWLRLSLAGTSATLADSGRIYDSSSLSPRSYIYSSIMVNSAGDMVMGFSGAGHNDYIGAFCAGRLATDPLGQTSPVKMLAPGEAPYSFELPRWGDYSHTTLDPNDGLAIWTIQQHARAPESNWRTWIGEITPIKP